MTLMVSNHKYDLGKVYLTLYLFAFIFAPPLIVRLNFFHILFMYTLMVLALRYRVSVNKAFQDEITKTFYAGYGILLVYVMFLMFLCILSGKINLINEVTQLYRTFMVVVELPVCAIYIALYCKKYRYNYLELIKSIIAAGLIQSVFTILMVSSPDIKARIVEFMSKTNGDGGSFLNMSAWEYARRYNAFSNNLQDALGWGTGIITALALFMALKYKKKYFWVMPILFLVPLFNSVTGVIFVFVVSAIILLPYFLKRNFQSIKYIIGLLIFSVAVVCIVKTTNPFVYNWVKQNLLAIGKLGKGSASYTSFGHLMNNSNWQFPDSPLEFLFGTGHNVMGDAVGYHHADPGITNNIWLMGLLGTVYLYVFWFFILRKAGSKVGKGFKSLYFALWMCLTLFEIKGLSNFYNPGLAVTVCLLFSPLAIDKSDKAKDMALIGNRRGV